VQLQGSPGVNVDLPRYPGPRRFSSERGATSYGYSGEVVLFAKAAVAGDATGRVEVVGEAAWLACTDVCRKETAIDRLSFLPSDPPQPVDTEGLNAHFERLPAPAAAGGVSGRRVSSDEIVLEAKRGTQLVEFFPEQPMGADDRDCEQARADPSALSVTLNYGQVVVPIRGVVRAQTGNTERYFSVELD
jgi:hypothetical protein